MFTYEWLGAVTDFSSPLILWKEIENKSNKFTNKNLENFNLNYHNFSSSIVLIGTVVG